MLKFLNCFLIFIIATLLHWVFIEVFAPLNINVGVMLCATLLIAGRFGRFGGYGFAFFSGLFLDFFGNVLFGGYALVFTGVAFIYYNLEDKIDFHDITPQIVLAAGLNFISVILYGVLGSVFAGEFLWQGFRSLFLGSLITGALMPLIYIVAVKYFIFDFSQKPNESKAIF